MGCFTATATNGYDARPTDWTTVVSLPNVFVSGSAADAGILFNAYRVFSTGTINVEFRAVAQGNMTQQPSFYFLLNGISGAGQGVALAGCLNIPGGPQTILFQVRVIGGTGNICFAGGQPRTGVVLT